MLRRQAVVNAGLTFLLNNEKEKDPATGKPWHESLCYENGIADYVAGAGGEDTLTPVVLGGRAPWAATARTSRIIRSS